MMAVLPSLRELPLIPITFVIFQVFNHQIIVFSFFDCCETGLTVHFYCIIGLINR